MREKRAILVVCRCAGKDIRVKKPFPEAAFPPASGPDAARSARTRIPVRRGAR
jgi:hypothetical protein